MIHMDVKIAKEVIRLIMLDIYNVYEKILYLFENCYESKFDN